MWDPSAHAWVVYPTLAAGDESRSVKGRKSSFSITSEEKSIETSCGLILYDLWPSRMFVGLYPVISEVPRVFRTLPLTRVHLLSPYSSPESRKDFLKAVHSILRDKHRRQLLKTESLPSSQQYVPFGGKRLCALKGARPAMSRAGTVGIPTFKIPVTPAPL